MKITKSQLKKLIKEELSKSVNEVGEAPGSAEEIAAVEKMKNVMKIVEQTYNNLPNDAARAIYAEYLEININEKFRLWKERAPGTSGRETEVLPKEI